MERTCKEPHAQTQSNSPSAHTQVEAEQREAIFHCYYERAWERSANTADLHSGPPLVGEQVRV